MHVRICPKCQCRNDAMQAVCVACGTPLHGVPLTFVNSGPQVQPAAAEQTQQMGAPAHPYPAPNQTVSMPPPPQMARQAIKKGPSLSLAIALGVAVVAIMGIAVVMAVNKPLTPEQQVMESLTALGSGDYETVKAYLTRPTLDKLIETYGSEEELKSKIAGQAPFGTFSQFTRRRPSDVESIRFRDPAKSQAVAVIAVPADTRRQLKSLGMQNIEIGLYFVREDERYKLDLPTSEREITKQVTAGLAKRFGALMQQQPSPSASQQMPSMPIPTPPQGYQEPPAPPPAYPQQDAGAPVDQGVPVPPVPESQ